MNSLSKHKNIKLKEVSLPSLPLMLEVYYTYVPAEAASNLSRYGYFGPFNQGETFD